MAGPRPISGFRVYPVSPRELTPILNGLTIPTLHDEPMKNMACFPPTPKYEMSLFRDLGASRFFSDKDGSSVSLSGLKQNAVKNFK